MNLPQAHRIVAGLLAEADLPEYCFEVEPGDAGWSVRIEFPVEGVWKTTKIELSWPLLTAALHDRTSRSQLLEEWKTRLNGR